MWSPPHRAFTRVQPDHTACHDGGVLHCRDMSTSPGAGKLRSDARAAIARSGGHGGCGTSTARATTVCLPTVRRSCARTTSASSTRRFLMLHGAAQHQLRRQGRVHGLVEDEVPVPGDGDDPDRPLGRRQEPGRPRRGRGRAAARRAVRHLPGGHAQPRRLPLQGPHRRRPVGDEARLPDLPGRHRRHRRDPATRRQGAQAVPRRARSRSAGRSRPSATATRPTAPSSAAR